MTHRSILAVTDFSLEGNHALNRAALLSAEHGSVLHLACFSDTAEAPPADALIRLARHAQQLSQMHGIVARAASDLAHKVDDLLPAASAADLVVWGTAPTGGLGSLVFVAPVDASLSLNKAARVELVHAISTANEGKLATPRFRITPSGPTANSAGAMDGARTDILVVPHDWRPAVRRVRAGAPQIARESSPGPDPHPSSAAAAFRRAA